MTPTRRRSTLPTLLGPAVLVLAACGASPAQVEVRTYVGDTFDRRDPALQREALAQVFQTLLPDLPSLPSISFGHDDSTQAKPSRVDTSRPPKVAAEFDALVDAIRRGPIDDLGGPAERLAQSAPKLWPHVRDALLAERAGPKTDYRSVLAVIGGDVPNRYGHFELTWKQAHGYPVRVSQDWFADLLAVPRGAISVPLLPVFRDCVLEVALLRAAAHLGREPDLADAVVETLLEVAYAHHGTFRDEVARALVALGVEGLPALAASSVTDDLQSEGPDPRAAFARFILDKMERQHPRRALEAVRAQPRILERLLAAYGRARTVEAPEALLDFVDDPSPTVRATARAAFEAYVQGPPPRAAQRSVRLLGGGTTTARAYLTYRTRATLALRDRLMQTAPELLGTACADGKQLGEPDPTCAPEPAPLAAAYFATLDEHRRRRTDDLVTAALTLGDPADAERTLNRLLAEEPTLGEVPRVVEFFEHRARTLEAAGDLRAAATGYRKAAMLSRRHAPLMAQALEVRALVHEASVPGLGVHGQTMLLRTALELDPSDRAARDALDALERDDAASLIGPWPWRSSVLAALVLALGLALAWGLGGLARRRWLETPAA